MRTRTANMLFLFLKIQFPSVRDKIQQLLSFVQWIVVWLFVCLKRKDRIKGILTVLWNRSYENEL